MMRRIIWLDIAGVMARIFLTRAEASDQELQVDTNTSSKPMNVVLILSDDHRHDVMGFLGHPWVETPHMDSMAREGVHFANAMVTTSLCSPSRASILTGCYMHNHGVTEQLARGRFCVLPEYGHCRPLSALLRSAVERGRIDRPGPSLAGGELSGG